MSELLGVIVLTAGAGGAWKAGRSALAAGLAVLDALLVVAIVGQLARWVGVWLGGVPTAVLVVLAVLAGLAVAVGWCWWVWTHHRTRTRRWGRAVRRKDGLASTVDVLRYGSGSAMRRQATRVRPSLRELTRWQRRRLPVTEVAVPLCRAGRLRVWASIEDVVLAFGIPRYGKTAWLGGLILDAPGAVIATSTKPDLYEATRELRGRRGPVAVFNATGVGGLASSVGFDPVSGCADPVVAGWRAQDMLPCGDGDGEREHWTGLARDAFAGLLHAAALGGLDMSAISGWVADPDHAAEEVVPLLEGSDDPSGAYAKAAIAFFDTNTKTRSSITASMRPAFAWLPNPHARACTDTTGHGEFTVAQLLRTRGSVYVLGAEDGSTASLVAGFTGHIAREARRIADLQPGGRLDPTLRLALDEAALICPIPLDRWSADMGGRGIQIVACFQSRSQVIGRWGATGAACLINNAGALLLYGGCKDAADLAFWSALFGDRDEEVLTRDAHGGVQSRGVRKVPVFSPAQLASLPKFRVVVWRSSMLPVLGKVEKFWTRREYRDLHTALQRAERQVVAAAGATHTTNTQADATQAAGAGRTPSGARRGRLVGALRRRRARRLVETSRDRARSGL
jgi:hypothetical protein